MYKLAITTPVGNEPEETLLKMVDEVKGVCSNLPEVKGYKIIFSTDDYTSPASRGYIEKIAYDHPEVVINTISIRDKNQTFARTYFSGFERAINEGADIIIEMDVGSHDPSEIINFVNKFKEGYDCVFSSRFIEGGGFINYPKQRVIISKFGTLLTNFVFGFNPPLSDLTSGYEAFTSDILKKLFAKVDIENLVCVKAVPHLIQTELRVLLVKMGAKYGWVPIQYGYNKKGKKLKFKYLFKAFFGFIILTYRVYSRRLYK